MYIGRKGDSKAPKENQETRPNPWGRPALNLEIGKDAKIKLSHVANYFSVLRKVCMVGVIMLFLPKSALTGFYIAKKPFRTYKSLRE